MGSSIFTRIVNGEIPCYKVAESAEYMAFLDVNPLTEGHTLVIPKQEIDYIFELDDVLYIGLFLFSKKVANAIEKVIPCKRIGVAVVGLEVPHAHVHLIPVNNVHDVSFAHSRIKLPKEKFKEIADKISASFNIN